MSWNAGTIEKKSIVFYPGLEIFSFKNFPCRFKCHWSQKKGSRKGLPFRFKILPYSTA